MMCLEKTSPPVFFHLFVIIMSIKHLVCRKNRSKNKDKHKLTVNMNRNQKRKSESDTWFDRFPIEIISCIFDYLSTNHILYSFFYFHQRIRNL
jgi:hypothetical protein